MSRSCGPRRRAFPVEIKSPGSSVTMSLMKATTAATGKICCPVRGVLLDLAVDRQLHLQLLRIGNRVGRRNARAAGAERVVPFAVLPVEPLVVRRAACGRDWAELAVGNVVDDRVAGDVFQRLGLA